MIKSIENNINFRENKKYYIYIHTCPNSRRYIGLSQNPKQRWNNGEGYKENIEFYKLIKKYGWENIKHEIVAETYYGWVARKIEKTLITTYKKNGLALNRNNEDKPGYISQRKVPLKKIGKYTKDGELIKIYNSATEAWRDGNICSQNIQACCRGTIKTAGGFVWKYI